MAFEAHPASLLRLLLVGGTEEEHASLTVYIGGVGYRQTSLSWEPDPARATNALDNGHFDVAAIDYTLLTADPRAWARRLTDPTRADGTPRYVLFNAPDEATEPDAALAWTRGMPRLTTLCPMRFDALVGGRSTLTLGAVQPWTTNWYEALVEASSASIAFVDPQFRVRAANQAFAHAYGAVRETLVGAHLDDLLSAEHAESLKSLLLGAFDGTQVDRKGRLELPDGTLLDTLSSCSPCYATDGRLLGAALIVRDITEMVAREREAERVARVQQAVVELQYQFVSGASSAELARRMLRAALALTGGCFAFFADIRDGEPVPASVRHTCSNHDCERRTSGECAGAFVSEDVQRALAGEIMSFIGPVKRPLLLPVAAADDDAVPFRHLLAFPLRGEARPIGVLYVGTRNAEWPDDVVASLEPLASTFDSVTSGSLALSRQRDAEVRYRHLYDENPALLIEVSPHGSIHSVNQFGAGIIGAVPDALVGSNFLELLLPDDAVFGGQVIDSVFAGADETTVAELRFRHGSGQIVWMRVTGRVISDAGTPTALLVCKDISEARKLSDELAYFAAHDVLTGLLNRREFERRVHLAASTAAQQEREHALFLVDLEMFRFVNDTAGHKAGDELLRAVASRLSGALRSRDIVARIGGDEFAVLIRDCGASQAVRVAEELLTAMIRDPFSWREYDFRLNASVGVVPIDGQTIEVSELMSTAEATCQEAKQGAASNIALSTGETSALKRRREEMRCLELLRKALSTDAFELFGQVIRPAGDDRGLVHFEVLIRMLTEDRIRLAPGAFLPVAERYRLAQQIDRWVIGAVFGWFAAHRELIDRLGVCSINLSGQSVGDPEMQGFIREQCMIHRVPADRFCFEVTETAMMNDIERSIEFIEALRRDGFRFAIDDFGTGLASFGYLKRLPVDYVKIDGLFVRDIEEDDSHAAIVSSINQISKVMGKKTIAEFVENDRIAKRLWTIGVDYVQGYGIAEPVPLAELAEQLSSDAAG